MDVGASEKTVLEMPYLVSGSSNNGRVIFCTHQTLGHRVLHGSASVMDTGNFS
jgi:hypothetical protein